jgi:parallel beta-helix repeat protein
MTKFDGVLFFNNCKNLVVRGITVRNNVKGHGILIEFGKNITIENCKIYGNLFKAIESNGDYISFISNEIFDNCKYNINGIRQTLGEGWPNALNVKYKPDNTRSTNILFHNNKVHDNWGEGICSIFSDSVIISKNTAYNNWSANILIESASNVLVEANFLFNHPDSSFYQADIKTYRKAKCGGIIIGTEWLNNSDLPYSACSEILIYNTITNYCKFGISFIFPAKTENNIPQFNTYQRLKIYHNTFINNQQNGIFFKPVTENEHRDQPADCELVNNIIDAANFSINGALDLGDDSDKRSWTVKNNCFPNGLPNNKIIGTQNSNNNSDNPGLLNISVLNDNCAFLKSDSPLRYKGYDLSTIVKFDYFGNTRTNITTIGAHEVDEPSAFHSPSYNKNNSITVKKFGNYLHVSGCNPNYPLQIIDLFGRVVKILPENCDKYHFIFNQPGVFFLHNNLHVRKIVIN